MQTNENAMITNPPNIGPGATPGPDPRRSRPVGTGPHSPAHGADSLSTAGSTGLRSAPAQNQAPAEKTETLSFHN